MQYIWVTIRHKWFVLLASFKVGLPFWRAITHDLSKFMPVELLPYNNYKFGDKSNQTGFAKALLHHWNFNSHHYQYWEDRYDHSEHYREIFKQSGIVQNGVFMMPETCVKEMIADWMGAGKANTGAWDMTGWLSKNLSKMRFHPQTRKDVRHVLIGLGYDV